MNNEGNYVATELSIGNPCKFLALLFCLTQFVPLRLSGIELKSASSYAVIRCCITILNIIVMGMKCKCTFKLDFTRFVVRKGKTVLDHTRDVSSQLNIDFCQTCIFERAENLSQIKNDCI